MRILPFSSDDAAGNIINVPASSVSAVKDSTIETKRKEFGVVILVAAVPNRIID